MKRRVIIFNGYYFPAQNYGGPSTSVENMIEACSEMLDFYLIVANHDFGNSKKFSGIKDGWNNYGKAKVKYVNDKDFTTKNIRAWIREVKPISIYLSGVLSFRNLRYILAARKEHIKVIIPPRGEVNDNAVKRKSYKKRPYFIFLRLIKAYDKCAFHATSKAEAEGLKKYLHIESSRIEILPNIPKKIIYGHIVEKKIGNLHAVFVARICKTKNLLEALRALKNINGNVVYDIYGPIEDEQYWRECQAVMAYLPRNVMVSYQGVAGVKDIKDIYIHSECIILPTITENYGHSIVEALVTGCPCIIPQETTPWDSINNYAGYTYKLGEIGKLQEAIQKIIDMDNDQYVNLVNNTYKFAEDNFISTNLVHRYIKLFTEGDAML